MKKRLIRVTTFIQLFFFLFMIFSPGAIAFAETPDPFESIFDGSISGYVSDTTSPIAEDLPDKAETPKNNSQNADTKEPTDSRDTENKDSSTKEVETQPATPTESVNTDKESKEKASEKAPKESVESKDAENKESKDAENKESKDAENKESKDAESKDAKDAENKESKDAESKDAKDAENKESKDAEESKDTDKDAKKELDPAKEAEETIKITAIVVEGNESVPTDEIIGVINGKIGDPFIESNIQRDIQAIFDLGYFTDVKVDTQSFIDGVKLVYTVIENPKVKQIKFEGVSNERAEKLTSLITTKVGEILNTKTLYTDIAAINRYYDEELGYLYRPTHIKDLNWGEDGTLKLNIVEGMVIKDIEITGNTVFKTLDIQKLITIKKGELFNQKEAKKNTDAISEMYELHDYILDNVRASIDPEKNLVSIKIVEAVVEEIQVEGLKRMKKYLVLRNMNTKPGKVLKRKRLQKDLERLNGVGYFSNVDLEPEAGSAPGKVILLVKVKEQKTGSATFGLGYMGSASTAIRSGVTGGVSYLEKSIKGTSWGVSASGQMGVGTHSFSFSIFNPTINDNRDSIGLMVYTQKYKDLSQPISRDPLQYAYYDDERSGFSLSYGHPLTEYLSTYLTLKSEKINLSRSSKSDYEPIGLFEGHVNSAILSVVYDNRDDLFNPLTGEFLQASYQTAGGILGGDEDFSKIQLELRKYFRLGKASTIALRAWGGMLTGNGGHTSDYFYLGGSESLRAYRDNIFIGDRMLLFNAEYRFPIAKLKSVSGAVFVDAGNAWFKDRGDSKLYTDAGVGLRIMLPALGLGVIRFDYALGQDGSRLTIGFGQSF